MSTIGEVHTFLAFLREVFVEKEHCLPVNISHVTTEVEDTTSHVHHIGVVARAPSSGLAGMVASSD
jgi:molybdenum cofactor sulfurtransferase